MINQIGREIGKDIYKGLKNSLTSTSSLNYSFLSDLRNFKLSSYDKVTIKNLINLIEKSEDINPRTFEEEWELCFIELDNKIDFCKEHLDKQHLSKLEELDKLNSVNYAIAKERHKTFVKKQIENTTSEIENYDNSSRFMPVFLSFLGLNSFYYKTGWGIWHILGMLLCIFIITTAINNAPSHDGVILAYKVSGVIYSLILLVSFVRIFKENKRIDRLRETLSNLHNYYNSIK